MCAKVSCVWGVTIFLWLLCASDVAVPHPDKKSVIMYVTSLFKVLPQSISMEAIKEVETLPRAASASIARVTTEEHYQIQTQQRFSQQVRHTLAHTHCFSVAVTKAAMWYMLWLIAFGFQGTFPVKKKSWIYSKSSFVWTTFQIWCPYVSWY